VKGFVPTPSGTVDLMVDLLFRRGAPDARSRILDPGCGTGAFIDGVERWCRRHRTRLPQIVGVESDPRHVSVLRRKFRGQANVKIHHEDFLEGSSATFDYVVGNPPYVGIEQLSEGEKASFRGRYAAARGRFDLYLLFFEQALKQLRPGGRLVFITPEKFLYVETAGALREMLARRNVEEIRLMPEDTFGELVTYPTITTINNAPARDVRVMLRDGTQRSVRLLPGVRSWLPAINGSDTDGDAPRLEDACLRVSCGVATGADGVFVMRTDEIDEPLRPFAYPTVAGRELVPGDTSLRSRNSMLIPYDRAGALLPLGQLGAFRRYLEQTQVSTKLRARTCVERKPWYAFHETPPLHEILQPKILCKDITDRPRFWADYEGSLVPRHSVYYIVPKNPTHVDGLLDYLRSDGAIHWLQRNCQRASKGFIRVQSRNLQRLPIPQDFVPNGPDHNSDPLVASQGQFSFG
jgi:adenine-specific DNA-methyltransferase